MRTSAFFFALNIVSATAHGTPGLPAGADVDADVLSESWTAPVAEPGTDGDVGVANRKALAACMERLGQLSRVCAAEGGSFSQDQCAVMTCFRSSWAPVTWTCRAGSDAYCRVGIRTATR